MPTKDFTKVLNSLGSMIKRSRIKRHLSIAELSTIADVSVGVICDLENHKSRVPTLINFMKLVRVLDLPSDVFVKAFKDKNREHDEFSELEHTLLSYGVSADLLPFVIKQIDTFIDTDKKLRRN